MIVENEFGTRVKELLKDNKITLIDLCESTKVSKAQKNRYVNHGVQPQGDVLNKIASMLATSIDFLLNGKSDEKAQVALKNIELLNQFKAVETMPENDRSIISELISAFIAKRQIQQIIR